MANMLEGGGKTPILRPEELEQLGFKLVAYPLSLLGVSIRAMQSALQLLKVHSPSGWLHSLRCIINAWQSACSTHMLKEKDVLELHTAPTVALRRYKAYWLACCPTLGIATPRYKVSDPVKPDIRTMRKS